MAGNPTRKGKRRRGPTMGNRWVRLVQKVPGLAMALVVLSLGAMTAPVLQMELALPADTTSNPDTTQRKAADIMSEGFGPGVNGPFLAVVDAHTVNAESGALAPLVDAQSQPEPAPAPEQDAAENAAPEEEMPEQPQGDQPAAEPEIAPAAEVVDTSADAADAASPCLLYTSDAADE